MNLDQSITTCNLETINKAIKNGMKPTKNTLLSVFLCGNGDIVNRIFDVFENELIADFKILDFAIQTNNLTIVNKTIKLIDKNKNKEDLELSYSDNPLYISLVKGNVNIINRIIDFYKKYPSIEIQSQILNEAIRMKNVDIIKKIVKLKGKPDNDSLDEAIQTNDIDIVNCLIECGANYTLKSLDFAFDTENIKIIDKIISLGAKSIDDDFNKKFGIGSRYDRYQITLSECPLQSFPH